MSKFLKKETNSDTGQLVKTLKDNSRSLMAEATMMQQETTKQLMERLKDVSKWKTMLEMLIYKYSKPVSISKINVSCFREIQELTSISDTLSRQGKRMQKADGCVGLASKVNAECLATRKKRQKVPGDNWRLDKVDSEFETESYLVKEISVKLNEAIREFENQVSEKINL